MKTTHTSNTTTETKDTPFIDMARYDEFARDIDAVEEYEGLPGRVSYDLEYPNMSEEQYHYNIDNFDEEYIGKYEESGGWSEGAEAYIRDNCSEEHKQKYQDLDEDDQSEIARIFDNNITVSNGYCFLEHTETEPEEKILSNIVDSILTLSEVKEYNEFERENL